MVCHCPPTWRGGDGCGHNCINRMLCIECTEDFCPCEHHCTNQMFTKKQYARLAVRRAGPKGFGLYADEDLSAGQFLIEYIGEVLEEDEYIRRKQYYIQTGQRHYYFMNIGNGEVIDACRKGNRARFINHSCEPNCETQKWMVRGELAIGLFTLRRIKAGEELTFDYNFERYGDKPMRCFCGSKRCRKFIGGSQESTADIVELGDAEDVTHDPEPVMVREEETDATVQAMLDREVGTTQRTWDTKMLARLQQLCQLKGIDWSVQLKEVSQGGRTASTQQPATGAASPEPGEHSGQGSGAAAPVSTSAGVSHAAAAASPASSSAPGGEAAAKAGPDLAESRPQSAALKRLKRKRVDAEGETADENEQLAAAVAAAGRKQQRQQQKQQRLRQLQEKKRQKQLQQQLKRQQQQEQWLQKQLEKQFKQQQEKQKRLEQQQRQEQQESHGKQQEAHQQQWLEQQHDEEQQEVSADEDAQQSQQQEEPSASEGADKSGNESEISSDDKRRVSHVCTTGADLEDDMSNEELQDAVPAPSAVQPKKRVRVVQSNRQRPTAATGVRAAAAVSATGGNSKQKGAATATGRRSFLTLSVSSAGKQLKRRSEVDRRLEQLVQKQSFKLKEPSQQTVVKVLRMFNLCDIAPRQPDPVQQAQQQQQVSSRQGSPVRSENGDLPGYQQQGQQQQGKQEQQQHIAEQSNQSGQLQQQPQSGDQLLLQLPSHLLPLQPLRGAELEARERESEARFKARLRARMADLGMLLDVVLASSSEKLKKEWVNCGILTQLQQTLGRIPFTQEYSVVLVKVIRVLEHLPLTPDDLYTVRSAHGTFADLIRRMASSASDWEVRRRSHQLLKRYAATNCSDATLLQLYLVPAPNGKPYLLSLHLPASQITRLMSLLPKNGPPARQAARRGSWRQQQQHRGVSSSHGPVTSNGPAEQQQQSSPSTAGEGPQQQQQLQCDRQGPSWRGVEAAAAEAPQYMQGNRPLGRGASSSQLASEGWETGPIAGQGMYSSGPGGFPPPWVNGQLLPPGGALAVFRHNRHNRQVQQSPGRLYGVSNSPWGVGGLAKGPGGYRRQPDRGFAGPDGLWGPDRVHDGPAGRHDGPGDRRYNRTPDGLQHQGGQLEGAWARPDDRNGCLLQQQQCGWDLGPKGPGCTEGSDRDGMQDWGHYSRDRRHSNGAGKRDSRAVGAADAAPKRQQGWQPLPASPCSQPSPRQQQQQQMPPISDLFAGAQDLGSEQLHALAHAHEARHKALRPPELASVEELCSLGVYAYHQLGGGGAANDEVAAGADTAAAAAAWLYPATSPAAAEAAAGGNLSPIVSGQFSPPVPGCVGAAAAAASPAAAASAVPPDSGLSVEDVFSVVDDAVVAVKTPGVSMGTFIDAAADADVGNGHLEPVYQDPNDQGHHSQGRQLQQHVADDKQPYGQYYQQQPGFRPSAALGYGTGAVAPQQPQQQQQQQEFECWEQPDAGFEAFVSDAVKRRLGKYVQPEHPNCISKEEARYLHRWVMVISTMPALLDCFIAWDRSALVALHAIMCPHCTRTPALFALLAYLQ
eukprot:GHRR01012236.1.p1 GENE.GHRR01012236.1~~GHRR01012236.1.p1  ORF type:complete len:1545 (+),score=749.24 GHRR01012236.1:1019-5653(+)